MEGSGNAEPPAGDVPGAPGDAPDMPGLVAFINAQHGTTFRLTDRLLHGKRNVAGLYNANGARFIVKWSPGIQDLERLAEAVRLVDRLRSRWYPVPRYTLRGLHPAGRYLVQTGLPGAPLSRLTTSQVVQVIALNEIQREQATSPSPEPWPQRIVDDVLEGGDGYCLLDPMRQHSPTTARLLDLVQNLVARHRSVSMPTTDVVHGDFQPNNMLGLSGKISGVVDWEGAQAGDRTFDLATVLFYGYDQETVRETLWPRVTTMTDPAAVAVYLGHLIHRQVDWSIRHHDQATVDRWLERAGMVWQEIPQRTGCEAPAWP
ncbi:MAG TPA: aminoglycoside phosphotransferase family protein [Chloroflexota bacterium]|nr:aminoglycoside phosphotransferase family protein [Chloroflexota bacterium]